MSEVHVTVTANVVFHNPGQVPLPIGAGQAVAVVKDSSGKTISVSGQVPGTNVVHRNPA